MGNRGIIHDPDNPALLTRHWQGQNWVCCVLKFPGKPRTLKTPRAYTKLFFLDEATALAAGHRPCRTCRRAEFDAFKDAWLTANPMEHDGSVPIKIIDRQIHCERVTRQRQQVRIDAPLETLPSGVMILVGSSPHLVWDDRLLPWGEKGYGAPVAGGSGTVKVLNPRSIMAAIEAGYRPTVHGSAG